MSTYYESAVGIVITLQRALKELEQHGITDTASIEAFYTECWQEHYRLNGTIYAHHVLNWLGY